MYCIVRRWNFLYLCPSSLQFEECLPILCICLHGTFESLHVGRVTNFLEALVHHSFSLCSHPHPKKISLHSPPCLFHDCTFPPILFTLPNLVIQLDFQTRSKHIFPHQRVIDEQWHIQCSLAECTCWFPRPFWQWHLRS